MVGAINLSVAAFICSLIAAYSFRKRNPWGTFWLFFLIIFFASWAGGLWIKPVGPSFLGIAWIPTLAIAFFVALIIAASAGYVANSEDVRIQEIKEQFDDQDLKISRLAWMLLIILIFTVIAALI
jgi:hypothetical protein